jgi:hypothetical protein
MRFKGKLHGMPYTIKDESLPIDTTLEFTKSQIVFPNSLSNVIWEDSHLVHGAFYKLDVQDNIDRHRRYYITYYKVIKIRLHVDRINEMKLRLVHGLFWFQKEPIGWIALAIALLSLIVDIFKGC